MQPKQQVINSGWVTSSWAAGQTVTVLGYAKTIVVVRNMAALSGGTYRVLVTPRQGDDNAPWVTIKSGTVLASGGVHTLKLTDPWDGLKVEAMHTHSGQSASIIVWTNRDPR